MNAVNAEGLVQEGYGGALEASISEGNLIKTVILSAEHRARAALILGHDPSTVREVFAASEAFSTFAAEVLKRQRHRWTAWLELHGSETGAELAARVNASEVL